MEGQQKNSTDNSLAAFKALAEMMSPWEAGLALLAELSKNTESPNWDKCAILAEHGRADPNVRDSAQRTVLHRAIEQKAFSTAHALINNADDLEAVDDKGRSALHYAALCGPTETARLLLEKGADTEASNSQNEGMTPLMFAVMMGEAATVKELLSHKANIEAQDIHGYTPLIYAAMSQEKDITHLLLKHSANPNTQDKNGHTAIDTAQNLLQEKFPHSQALPVIISTLKRHIEETFSKAAERGTQKKRKVLRPRPKSGPEA
ncbi:MAG: ankyrin repeat domain-containing protein [Alphaproteobacteria bacterium]|nr:ankyrin repeat domain-containing protein [Alphaproteobacteria bacterium]